MIHQVVKAIAITALLLLAWIGLVSGAQPDCPEIRWARMPALRQ